MDVAASPTKNMATEIPKLKEDKIIKEHPELEKGDGADDESAKKKRHDKIAEVLPTEYDKDDSRWTLKYRELAPGLVELMEHSSVYVNAEELVECKRLSNDCQKLARMLLNKIFTTSALSICSVTDATASDLDNDGTNIGPGLDEHATIILLKFVAQYGLEQDWKITDYQLIQNSIRRKMEAMRYVKKNEDGDEPLKKKLRQKCKEPPVEYSENDSRWTLKYCEPAPGLVELMKHSSVYVNAEELVECMCVADDCVTLARMLLNEIFTTSALSTCSVTDATASDLDNDGTNIGPGLDEHAMIILLKFVTQYGLEQDWKITDYQLIQNSIRQKMEMMRYVRENFPIKVYPSLLGCPLCLKSNHL